ncbi:hypothetical protein [Ensifer adhaerens]|uniref:hypothetical protein n=1 Tax=Ensifer adhaerens TaxID=106592 RepID=UPI000AC9849C|nr:hypothetical protein [Ensifer adhaerens]RAS06087.1 hypothetical protein DEU52_12259 [Ensifer adhaerens]
MTLRRRKHARGLNRFYARVSCLVKVSDVAKFTVAQSTPLSSRKKLIFGKRRLGSASTIGTQTPTLLPLVIQTSSALV